MALIYHNITPPEYFVGVHRTLARQSFRGRRELQAYADRCDLALGDSEFNRQILDAGTPLHGGIAPAVRISLTSIGRRTGCSPGSSTTTGRTSCSWAASSRTRRSKTLIRFFHAYHTIFNPRSRLLIVGAQSGFERYLASLHQLVAALELPHVHFVGHVSDEELVAFYDAADLFLCASE